MSSAENEALIHKFYEAFARKDGEAMAACYHDEVVFSDPAFGELRGADAGDMWRMLTSQARDLVVTHEQVAADEGTGSALWQAKYTFSVTKRAVVNNISARFVFRDGKIIEHRDTFDMKLWMTQALGLPGRLFGGTGFMQRKFTEKARAGLKQWQSKRAAKG